MYCPLQIVHSSAEESRKSSFLEEIAEMTPGIEHVHVE